MTLGCPHWVSLSAAWMVGCVAAAATPTPAAQTPPAAGEAPAEFVSQGASAQLPPKLGEAERERFMSSATDPPAAELGGISDALEGKHYPTSNEQALHRFQPYLEGLGGGYVGVGTDQAYLFIGWQRPQLAWLFDYDPVVSDVHRIYMAFLRKAENPDAFLALWTATERKNARAILDASCAEEDRSRVRETYSQYRTEIKRRLFKVAEQHRELGVKSFLTDQAQYDYVVALVRAGRVRPMVGDLTAKRGLVGIGEVSRELGVPVRALYMSNAEEYFRQSGYSEQFKKNARAVLGDGRSLVLRTLSTYPQNQDYLYAVQPGPNFLTWLERPWLRNVFQIAPRPKRTPEEIEADRYPVQLIDHAPEESRAAKRAAREAGDDGKLASQPSP
ncbi:MAG: hypothetical protein OEZ06_14895 [Myxococcales bacterium]|nr:hypothetical protein [Myxococcales bacterium]